MSRNSNYLEHIQCPACGNDHRFSITAIVIADVRNSGCEFHSNAEWGDDSPITCPECCRSGKVRDFTLPNP